MEPFSNLLWSSIHEAGHALYEQGIRDDMYGMPIGSACSLSIHESQSRIWENNIGRGKLFWKYWYPKLQQQVSDLLKQDLKTAKKKAFWNKLKGTAVGIVVGFTVGIIAVK